MLPAVASAQTQSKGGGIIDGSFGIWCPGFVSADCTTAHQFHSTLKAAAKRCLDSIPGLRGKAWEKGRDCWDVDTLSREEAAWTGPM